MHPNVPEELVRKTMDNIKKRLKEDIREKYFEGELLHEGDIVINKKTETIHEIVNCGTNYLTVVDDQGNISRMWIEDAVVANTLREDFDSVRRRRSTNNQIAFCGYKTKNFSKDIFETFKPLLKENINKFVLLSLIRGTDELLSESMSVTANNYCKTRALFAQTGKLLSKINKEIDHTYRFDIVEKLNEFELNEGFELTGVDKHRAAKIISSALDVEYASTPEETVNNAILAINESAYTQDALNLIGRMLNLATSSGINWNKDHFTKHTQELMGLK